MMYLLGLLGNYAGLAFSTTPLRRKVFTVLTIVLLCLITVCRGRVGTDTGGTYEPMVQDLDTTEGTEPLFLGLLYLLRVLFPTALTTVTMGLGLVLTGLLLTYALRAVDDELFVLQAYFLPAQYFDIAISGQREGLALALLLLAWQNYSRRHGVSTALLMVLALFTHYASAFWVLLWWLYAVGLKRRLRPFVVVAALLAVFSVTAAAKDYLLMKFALYFQSSYDRPNVWSGSSVIVLCLLLLAAVSRDRLPRETKQRLWIVTLGAMTLVVFIGFYSYSALRFLTIIEFSLLLGMLCVYCRTGLRLGPGLRRALVCIGLLAVVSSVRYVLAEQAAPVTNSPALPYHFLWEEAGQ